MENPTKAKEPDYGKRIETHPRGVSPPNDRQGHVNNAVFSTFLETGRCEVLYGGDRPLHDGASFVIASLKVDFLAEITWPGEVAIGTRVSRIGNSSLGLEQGLFSAAPALPLPKR